MTFKGTLFAALLFVAPVLASADTLPTEAACRDLVERVLVRASGGDLDGVVALVKPYSIVPPAEIDASIGKFKLQLPVIAQRFGAGIGSEFVREAKVGGSLVQYVYLQKFERHAMKWMFYFYRGKDGWVLNSLRFDDNILTLFPRDGG